MHCYGCLQGCKDFDLDRVSQVLSYTTAYKSVCHSYMFDMTQGLILFNSLIMLKNESSKAVRTQHVCFGASLHPLSTCILENHLRVQDAFGMPVERFGR